MAHPLDPSAGTLRIYSGSPPSTPGAAPDPRTLLDQKILYGTGAVPRELLVLAPKSLPLCASLEIVYGAHDVRFRRIASGEAVRLHLVTGTKVFHANVRSNGVAIGGSSPADHTWILTTPGDELLLNVPTVDDESLSLCLRLRDIAPAVADPPLDIF